MTKWVVVKAWGIDKNKKEEGDEEKKQDGGNFYPPYGMHMAAPYMLMALNGVKVDDANFKDALKKIIKWNYQYQIYKMVIADMSNYRNQYMTRIKYEKNKSPVAWMWSYSS